VSLAKLKAAWERRVERGWDDFVGELGELTQRGRTEPADDVVGGLATTVTPFAFAIPADFGRKAKPLVALVDQAVAELDGQTGEGRHGKHSIALLDLANVLSCSGLAVAAEAEGRIRRWLPRADVSRNDAQAFWYWTVGFAALALDDRPTYRRIAGHGKDEALPWDPGATFEFNVQGLLAHLAAAVERKVGLKDVAPAWENLLESFPALREADSLDPGALLWVARVVHHRIGGARLGQVAGHAHDDIWRLA
jgi:hypothetical protein